MGLITKPTKAQGVWRKREREGKKEKGSSESDGGGGEKGERGRRGRRGGTDRWKSGEKGVDGKKKG